LNILEFGLLSFPDRVYTTEEVKSAKVLVDQGYRHKLTVEGSPEFKVKVNQALDLIKTAGYHDFFVAHIREIKEIDGISQLRETEVAIWQASSLLRTQWTPPACLSKKLTI